MLLTGTPLQNTVEELFSLLHFLEPSQFPSESEFLKDFGDLKTEEQVGSPSRQKGKVCTRHTSIAIGCKELSTPSYNLVPTSFVAKSTFFR